MNKKKILITGGAGFIGCHLATRLAQDPNNIIVLLDNLMRGRNDQELAQLLSRPNLSFEQRDLTQSQAFEGIPCDFDYIYHLAALIGVRHVQERPDEVLRVNSLSVLNVLDFAVKNKNLKKLLFSSTSEIYAGTVKHFSAQVPTPEDVPLTVDDISSPRSTYALSKMFGESACFAFNKKYKLPMTIVRYHNVYGPRMGFTHVIPEMFVNLSQKTQVEVFSPEHTRSFCYVQDAVEMTILACEKATTNGEILNVGDSSGEISIMELARKIHKEINSKTDLIPGAVTPGSPARRCPDTKKIIKLTNYTPQVSLDSGIALTYEWYRNKLHMKYE